jgi:GTP-binding protein
VEVAGLEALVAIVGRPNVGKSTLFNRICQRSRAIVESIPGVTRDRIYQPAEWCGHRFTLVDTGGILPAAEDGIEAEVTRQAEVAIAEADVVLFVVDTRMGPSPGDREVAQMLRESHKRVIVVANKTEGDRARAAALEFYSLGLGDPLEVSAQHGLGIGDLLDHIVEGLPPAQPEENLEAIRVALVGRPNVGKSSLLNALVGQERSIVHEAPGTTRDAVDTIWESEEGRFVFTDTAGMRRRTRVKEPVERYSIIRSIRAMGRSDVVLLVLDALESVADQERKIAGQAKESGKALVIVVNKWDAVEKDASTALRVEERIRQTLYFVDYAPVVFTSALTGRRVDRLPGLISSVYAEASKEVPTPALNRVLEGATQVFPSRTSRPGRPFRLYYTVQAGVRPPTFLLFCNDPGEVKETYLRYLEGRLRAEFGFAGTPLRFVPKSRKR